MLVFCWYRAQTDSLLTEEECMQLGTSEGLACPSNPIHRGVPFAAPAPGAQRLHQVNRYLDIETFPSLLSTAALQPLPEGPACMTFALTISKGALMCDNIELVLTKHAALSTLSMCLLDKAQSSTHKPFVYQKILPLAEPTFHNQNEGAY